MDASIIATHSGAQVDFAVLSDTRDDKIALQEQHWFARLLARQHGEGRMFYRRREKNTGRKLATLKNSSPPRGGMGYAVILDADA